MVPEIIVTRCQIDPFHAENKYKSVEPCFPLQLTKQHMVIPVDLFSL